MQLAQPIRPVLALPICIALISLGFAAQQSIAHTDGTAAAAGSVVPAGAVVIVMSGTCPTGYVEETDLDGRVPLGTVTAHADLGTTGGADALVPAGTNSVPTFSGQAALLSHAGLAVADHASHTHSYSDLVTHTHTVNVNDPGHTHLTQRYPTTTGALSGFTIDTSMSGTITDNTLPTKAAATGVTATTSAPAGSGATGITAGPSTALTHGVTPPSDHSYTPVGTVTAPIFTGTSTDNRSAFRRVLFCRKT